MGEQKGGMMEQKGSIRGQSDETVFTAGAKRPQFSGERSRESPSSGVLIYTYRGHWRLCPQNPEKSPRSRQDRFPNILGHGSHMAVTTSIDKLSVPESI